MDEFALKFFLSENGKVLDSVEQRLHLLSKLQRNQ